MAGPDDLASDCEQLGDHDQDHEFQEPKRALRSASKRLARKKKQQDAETNFGRARSTEPSELSQDEEEAHFAQGLLEEARQAKKVKALLEIS